METSEDRCLRWDKLISEGKSVKVVKEFDLMIATKGHLLTVRDLVKRDEALEKIGVISFTKERAKKIEEMERGSRRGKY